MYGWFFRHLPGPVWFKVIEALALVAFVVFALFQWVYPTVHERLGDEMTVQTQSSQSADLETPGVGEGE